MAVELQEHGKRLNTTFSALPSDPTGVAQLAPGEVEVIDHGLGSARRYDKQESASPRPQALGWIKGVYSDAIEYTGMTKELRGLSFMYGLVLGLPITFGIGGCGLYLAHLTLGIDGFFDLATSLLIALAMAALGVGFGAYIFSTLMRNDLFMPQDLPVIFDRKHRKVYRLLQDHPGGLWRVFKRWPLMACEYEWDLVDVEHHIDTSANGATVRRDHSLIFLVRKSHDDASLIDAFQIANPHALDEGLVDSMWEHIRRFMEEDGPHLPHHTEPLANLEAPKSWWESMGTVSAFGPNFTTHWKNSPVVTSFMLLLFPLTLPIMLLWGTGNYLCFKTAFPVRWPKTVLERIGSPILSPVTREAELKI